MRHQAGRIGAVLFDCDGVLIDNEVSSIDCLILKLARHGIATDRAYVMRHFMGRSFDTVIRHAREVFARPLPDSAEEDYRLAVVRAFAAAPRTMPGLPLLLRRLALPWAVVTSSTRARVQATLGTAGLWSLVEPRLFTTEMVTRSKPAPDLFLLAAERLGVPPDRCVVIEDSLPGLQAARAAGMTSWHFKGGGHMRGQQVDYCRLTRPDAIIDCFSQVMAQDLLPLHATGDDDGAK